MTEDFFDPLRACCAISDFANASKGVAQGEGKAGAMRRRDTAMAIFLILLVLPVVVLMKLAALTFRF